MANTNLKGQATVITLFQDGEAIGEINSIKDHSTEFGNNITKDGYLGEDKDRRSETWDGCSGKLTCHFSSGKTLTLLKLIKEKAQGKNSIVFSLTSRYTFPDGVKTLQFDDLSFAPFSIGNPGRSEYNTLDLAYECEEFDVI